MSEEKKIIEETAEQAPVTPEEETTPAAEEAAPPVPEAAGEETPEIEIEEEPEDTPNKKIRLMTIEEVEKKLARSRLKMGGSSSVYIRHLLARKAELEGGGEI